MSSPTNAVTYDTAAAGKPQNDTKTAKLHEDVADRPARRQVKEPVTAMEPSSHGTDYNIWTHRGYRQYEPGMKPKVPKSDYRCNAKLDCGWTKGEKRDTKYICLYFARGLCHHGADCNYRHRIPDASFEVYHQTQPQYDIFGRGRDVELVGTKGVGTLSRDCTTLYMYLGSAASLPQERLEDLVRKNFEEWGPIEAVNVIPRKAIAFVRYEWRSSAEFAKTAMHQQQLRGDTESGAVLDVRWANDDPNPKAIERVKRRREEAFVKAYMQSIEKLGPEEKRAKMHELALSGAYVPGDLVTAYPDTSDQFPDDDIGRYLMPDDVLEGEEQQDDSKKQVQSKGSDHPSYVPFKDSIVEAIHHTDGYNNNDASEGGDEGAIHSIRAPQAALGLISGYESD